ncbi:MAG: hypothetical protein ACI8XO_003572 [Verrucomicrobiales bacterium]
MRYVNRLRNLDYYISALAGITNPHQTPNEPNYLVLYRKYPLILIVDVIAIIAAVMIYLLTGEVKLGESSFLTHLSGAQLLGVAIISFLIFRVRNLHVEKVYSLKNPRIIWALIAAGFFFLMADELFKIHESIDEMIHSIFNLEENGFTDRIDDLLILLYALIGIAVIAAYRREFLLMNNARVLFICGFGLLFLMVGLDVLTNRDDILRSFLGGDRVESVGTWLSFAEEGAKILSGGFFIMAFQIGLRTVRSDKAL